MGAVHLEPLGLDIARILAMSAMQAGESAVFTEDLSLKERFELIFRSHSNSDRYALNDFHDFAGGVFTRY